MASIARTPEKSGTFYDVRDIIIVKGRSLRFQEDKQETIRYPFAKVYPF